MAGQRRRNQAGLSARILKLGENRDRRDGRMGVEYAVVADGRWPPGGGAVDLTLRWQDLLDLSAEGHRPVGCLRPALFCCSRSAYGSPAG